KDENGISAFVRDRHAIGERTFPNRPSHVHTQRLVNPRASVVLRIEAERVDHAPQLRLGLLARQPGQKTDDTWHSLTYPADDAFDVALSGSLFQRLRIPRSRLSTRPGIWSASGRWRPKRSAARPVSVRGM